MSKDIQRCFCAKQNQILRQQYIDELKWKCKHATDKELCDMIFKASGDARCVILHEWVTRKFKPHDSTDPIAFAYEINQEYTRLRNGMNTLHDDNSDTLLPPWDNEEVVAEIEKQRKERQKKDKKHEGKQSEDE